MTDRMAGMSHSGILIFLKDLQPESEKTIFSDMVKDHPNPLAFPALLAKAISQKKFPVQVKTFAEQLGFSETPALLSKRALHNLLFWSVGFQVANSMFKEALLAISSRVFTFRAGEWIKTLELPGMTQKQINFQTEQVKKSKNELGTMYSNLEKQLTDAATKSACKKQKDLFKNLSGYLSENKQHLLTPTVSLFSIVLQHIHLDETQTIDENMQASYKSHWENCLNFQTTTVQKTQQFNEQRQTLLKHEKDLKKSGEQIAQERTKLGKTSLNQIDACNKARAEVLAEETRVSRVHEAQQAQLQLQINTLLQKLVYQPEEKATLGFLSTTALFRLQARHVLSPEELKKRIVGDSQLPPTSVASSYASVPDLFLALKDALATIESNRYSVLYGQDRDIVFEHREHVVGHAAYENKQLQTIERGRILSSKITVRRHSTTGELFIHHMRPEKVVGQFHKPANLK